MCTFLPLRKNEDKFILHNWSKHYINALRTYYTCIDTYVYLYTHVHVCKWNSSVRSQSQELEKRVSVSDASVRMCRYTGANHGITVSWICRSYVRLCILHTPPLLIQSETWPSQSKTRPSLSLLLPAHVSRSLSRSLTFSNHALAAGYSWSKRFQVQPFTAVLKAPGSGSLGTPHDVLLPLKKSAMQIIDKEAEN